MEKKTRGERRRWGIIVRASESKHDFCPSPWKYARKGKFDGRRVKEIAGHK